MGGHHGAAPNSAYGAYGSARAFAGQIGWVPEGAAMPGLDWYCHLHRMEDLLLRVTEALAHLEITRPTLLLDTERV